MNRIVSMQFGSHVYGTTVPTSDQDFKAVYIPTAREILLQRTRGTVQANTKSDPHAKNSASDIDVETYSIQTYLRLLMEGQTVALDMLFTPKSFYQPLADGDHSSPVWEEIQDHKNHFLSTQMKSFVGYCQTQAAKYGIKGSRVAVVRDFLEMTAEWSPIWRLADVHTHLEKFIQRHDHASIVSIPNPKGEPELHLEICNRKIPFFANVKYAREVFQKIFDKYGERALQAEKNEGVDWKALMHAVRVSHEAKELLLTGNISFPRPEAPLLLQVRKGELPYAQVAEIIEQGLQEVEAASLVSTLRKEPDKDLADEIVMFAHQGAVLDDEAA